uniref:Solute carrier organic anion transporter family member n=1 Tax=Echeneis naucrates TaxID=173247 RepID=A0A665VN20_ECHNA
MPIHHFIMRKLFPSLHPVASGPRSPSNPGADGPVRAPIFTGASTLPGQLYGVKKQTHAEPPIGLKLIHTDLDQLCGWGALTPKALQVFNTPRWVLFFLCVASFLQGMIINGFINTVITSIERRFDLRSYQAGLIASSYDIAACVCLAFVSYFGGTGHKPRWLGWGVLIMAFGSLVFALPHFTTPPYQISVPEQTGMCSANRTSPCQDKEGGGLSSYRFVFMLGQFLHGMGATPLYTLGVTYLDENVKSNYAPVYIGIFYTAAIVGPAAGYLLGGYFLNIFTDIHLSTEMTPENPLWVGAWWIGFLAGGAAALLVAFPILGYPRQLPGSQEYVAMRVSEAHQLKDGSHTTASDPQFGKSVKDMPRSVLLLLKNPTFLFLCLAGATEATLIAGMSTFGPKFLESQFSLSASEAATWFGYMVVPAGGGGTFLGGYMVKRLNLRCRGIIRFCMVCAMVSLLAIFIFLIHCPNVPMAGVTAPYHGQTGDSLEENLTVGCNAGCSCSRDLYNPVCGADGVMYYSSCHAGCSSINHTERSTGKQVRTHCQILFSMVWAIILLLSIPLWAARRQSRGYCCCPIRRLRFGLSVRAPSSYSRFLPLSKDTQAWIIVCWSEFVSGCSFLSASVCWSCDGAVLGELPGVRSFGSLYNVLSIVPFHGSAGLSEFFVNPESISYHLTCFQLIMLCCGLSKNNNHSWLNVLSF